MRRGKPISATFRAPLEKDEQRDCVKMLTLAGFTVRSTSQYRASHVAEGIPDLMVHHRGLAVAGWFECKAYQSRGWTPFDRTTWRPKPLSPAQEIFRDDAVLCGQLHGWGGRKECEEFLIGLGLASRMANGAITIHRRAHD